MDFANIKLDYTIIGSNKNEAIQFAKEFITDSKDYIVANTSGSTGTPKEIYLSKSDLLKSAVATCEFLNIPPNGVMALLLPIKYIAGKMIVLRSMITSSIVWSEPPSLTPLKKYDLQQSISLASITPSQIEGLITSPHIKKIGTLLVGGAPISPLQEDILIDHQINAYCTYGMTETCSHVALRKIGESVYTALPGISFEIDKRNCLVIHAPQTDYKEITTNDIVELISSKEFRWVGRIDNAINSGGIKLHPEKLESKISTILNGINYYFTSQNSTKWGEELILMIESPSSIPDIELKLKQLLSKYEMPKAIFYVEHFERTTSGKIKRLKPNYFVK